MPRQSAPLSPLPIIPHSNNPPSQAPVHWAVEDTHTLVFTAYTPSYPERDYFAALISLQTAIFANYTTSPSPTLEEEVIDYNAYGITIEIDNWYGALYYKLLSQMVGEVGAFLQSWKKCEATWRLVERDEQFGRGARVLCVGAIKKEAVIGGGENAKAPTG